MASKTGPAASTSQTIVHCVLVMLLLHSAIALRSGCVRLRGGYGRQSLRALTSSRMEYPLRSSPADDIEISSDTNSHLSGFSKLGLCNELQDALTEQNIEEPTPVQKAVIPRIVNGENLVMAACTGSGKTLAYTLPIVQTLNAQESLGYERRMKRPRCLILVPTRELARQVLQTVKQLGHFSKVSSTAVLGGESYSIQKKSLDRLVDVVVASPGRLMQHKTQGHVYLSHVTHVVIDEVDTMLVQGFGNDIRAILRSVLTRQPAPAAKLLSTSVASTHQDDDSGSAQLIMATATLTKAVRRLLVDVEGGFNIQYSDPTHKTPRKEKSDDQRVKVNIVEVDGLHRSVPNVQHTFEETRGADKMAVLRTVIERHSRKNYRTLIFCNTVNSCRAVEYAMNDEEDIALSYHGDMKSNEREENLNKFRNGEVQYLVCTDIAARGLDIPEVRHVIIFDFPLNPVDYIHRSGRCGRAGRKGLVTSIVAKRDFTLANAIKKSIGKGLPLDYLTADKRDYTHTGRLASVLQPRKRKTIVSRSGGRFNRSQGKGGDGRARREGSVMRRSGR